MCTNWRNQKVFEFNQPSFRIIQVFQKNSDDVCFFSIFYLNNIPFLALPFHHFDFGYDFLVVGTFSRVPNITVGLNKSVGVNFSWKLIKKVAPNKSVGGKFS